jgi:hypothetical protein
MPSRNGRDGRASLPRRHRELARAFARDLGGEASLTAAERQMVEQAATITLRAEALKAKLLSGEEVNDDAMVRLTNSSTRILTALGVANRKRKPAGPSLAEHIAGMEERVRKQQESSDD